MLDDGDYDLGAALGWFMVICLLAGGSDRARDHAHGNHCHRHEIPRGYHVHDGGPDGPIQMVPPTPQQLADAARRRSRNRAIWASIAGTVGLILLLNGSSSGLALAGGALILADRTRYALRDYAKEAWRSFSSGTGEVEAPCVPDELPIPRDEEKETSVEPIRDARNAEPGVHPTTGVATDPGAVETSEGHTERMVGPFTITHVLVRIVRGAANVVSRFHNHTSHGIEYCWVTATVFHDDHIVAVGSESIENVVPGETRTVTFDAPDRYGPHDRVTFQIDHGRWA